MITVRRSIQPLPLPCFRVGHRFPLDLRRIGGSEFAGGGTGGQGSARAPSRIRQRRDDGVHYRTDNQVVPGFQTKKFTKGKVDRTSEGDRDVSGRHGRYRSPFVRRQQRRRDRLRAQPRRTDHGEGIRSRLCHPGPWTYGRPGQRRAVPLAGPRQRRRGQRLRRQLRPHPRDVCRSDAPAPLPSETFEIKGFISNPRPSDRTFEIGPLPTAPEVR